MSALLTGRGGERRACRYLESLGFVLLERNYRAGRHEIDLVMRDGDTTVFVEVKTRKSARFGTPAEAVGREKQRCLILAAQQYLLERGLMDAFARFDVVEVYTDPIFIHHIRNAFSS